MEFEILENVFAQLPPIERDGGRTYPVNFHYGSHADLMKFLAINRKTKGAVKYPLIWLETPITFDGYEPKYGRREADMVFHIATLSNADWSNHKRSRITFQQTLEPITDLVIDILRTDKTTGIPDYDNISLTKTFKYDTDEENQASDIWDAITLSCRVQINYNC